MHRQAEAIRQQGIFADVQAAFLRDEPHPKDLIAASDFRDIYVVPFMVSEGYSIDVMIPQTLPLDGALTEIITGTGRKRVHLCRAIGTHRAIWDHSMNLISSITSGHGLSPDDTTALVLCHGTKRHSGGRAFAEQVVRDLQNSGLVAHSAMLFMKDTPTINEWRSVSLSRYVIALPYLMTAGPHGAVDIPDMLGIDTRDATFNNAVVDGAVVGPLDIGGRKLWYTPLLGSLDLIPDIVIDRVAERAKSTVVEDR